MQISLRGKFALAIGTIVALTAVAVWVAISSLTAMQENVLALSQEQIPGIERAAQVSSLSNALALDAAKLAQAVDESDRKGAYHAFSIRFDQLRTAVNEVDNTVPNRSLETQMMLMHLQAKTLNDLVAKRLELRDIRTGIVDEIPVLRRRLSRFVAKSISEAALQLDDEGLKTLHLTVSAMRNILDDGLMRASTLMELREKLDRAQGLRIGQRALASSLIGEVEKLFQRYQDLGGHLSEGNQRSIRIALSGLNHIQKQDQKPMPDKSPVMGRHDLHLEMLRSWLVAQIKAETTLTSRAIDAASGNHKQLMARLLGQQSRRISERFQMEVDLNLLTGKLLQAALEDDPAALGALERGAIKLHEDLLERLAPYIEKSPLDTGTEQLRRLIKSEDGVFARQAQRLDLEAKTREATQTVLFGTRAIASTANMITDDAVRTIKAQSRQLETTVLRDRWFLTIVGLLTVALALLIGLFLVDRGLSKPLQHLIEATKELAAGDHDITIPEGARRDEIGAMARALDVFKQNANDLRLSLEREKELNNLQRQFVAMVSHEFRTPLSIISGTAQRVRRRFDTMTPDRRTEQLQKIETAVQRLIRLIESVLNVSKLDAGKLQLKPAPIDLKEITLDIGASMTDAYPNHRLEMTTDGLDGTIDADEMLLRQALINLISNAFKYSPEGSCVRLRGEKRDDLVCISIADEGVGIPEDELPKLFQRFFRASTSTGIPGTGIGLDLARNIAEMHGGQIDVTSQAGVGTTFTLTLPSTLAATTANDCSDDGRQAPAMAKGSLSEALSEV